MTGKCSRCGKNHSYAMVGDCLCKAARPYWWGGAIWIYDPNSQPTYTTTTFPIKNGNG